MAKIIKYIAPNKKGYSIMGLKREDFDKQATFQIWDKKNVFKCSKKDRQYQILYAFEDKKEKGKSISNKVLSKTLWELKEKFSDIVIKNGLLKSDKEKIINEKTKLDLWVLKIEEKPKSIILSSFEREGWEQTYIVKPMKDMEDYVNSHLEKFDDEIGRYTRIWEIKNFDTIENMNTFLSYFDTEDEKIVVSEIKEYTKKFWSKDQSEIYESEMKNEILSNPSVVLELDERWKLWIYALEKEIGLFKEFKNPTKEEVKYVMTRYNPNMPNMSEIDVSSLSKDDIIEIIEKNEYATRVFFKESMIDKEMITSLLGRNQALYSYVPNEMKNTEDFDKFYRIMSKSDEIYPLLVDVKKWTFKPTPEQRKSMLKDNSDVITYFPNPTREEIIFSARNYPRVAEFYSEQMDEDTIRYCVIQNPYLISKIKNPSEKLKIMAIKKDYKTMDGIKVFEPNLQKTIIQIIKDNDVFSFSYLMNIKKPIPEMQKFIANCIIRWKIDVHTIKRVLPLVKDKGLLLKIIKSHKDKDNYGISQVVENSKFRHDKDFLVKVIKVCPNFDYERYFTNKQIELVKGI